MERSSALSLMMPFTYAYFITRVSNMYEIMSSCMKSEAKDVKAGFTKKILRHIEFCLADYIYCRGNCMHLVDFTILKHVHSSYIFTTSLDRFHCTILNMITLT